MSACVRCASTRTYAFEASPSARAKPENLPVVCRDCGQIMIAGAAVSFPPELEAQAKTMAQQAAEAVEAALVPLADPDQPVRKYLTRFHREAFLDGFWRALLYFRHNAREGRVKRLRELWRSVAPIEERRIHDRCITTLQIPSEVYAEFVQLLELGAGEPDGTRPSNQDPPVPGSAARMP